MRSCDGEALSFDDGERMTLLQAHRHKHKSIAIIVVNLFMKFSPLLVIFAVSAGGAIGGFWGIIISLPIAIVIKTTYNFYQRDIDKKIKFIKKDKSIKDNL